MIRTSLEKLRNTSVVMQEAFDIEKGKRVETSRFDLIIADQEAIEYRNSGEVQAKELKIQFSPYIS
ncbi:hypothetical protein NXH56_09210, partial [Bifidobacterium thermophilum]|nr:hypothetical protein [Bifidobacterium thermophilum]